MEEKEEKNPESSCQSFSAISPCWGQAFWNANTQEKATPNKCVFEIKLCLWSLSVENLIPLFFLFAVKFQLYFKKTPAKRFSVNFANIFRAAFMQKTFECLFLLESIPVRNKQIFKLADLIISIIIPNTKMQWNL